MENQVVPRETQEMEITRSSMTMMNKWSEIVILFKESLLYILNVWMILCLGG